MEKFFDRPVTIAPVVRNMALELLTIEIFLIIIVSIFYHPNIKNLYMYMYSCQPVMTTMFAAINRCGFMTLTSYGYFIAYSWTI